MAIWAAVALLICFISARQKVAFIWLLLFFQSRGAPPFQCVLVFAGFSFSHPTSLYLPHLTACRQTPHFFHLSFSYECCHFNFFFFSFRQGLVLKSSGTFCSAVVPISQSTKSPSPSPGEWSRCSLQNPFAARLRNPQNSLSPPLSLISPIRIQIWPLALFTPLSPSPGQYHSLASPGQCHGFSVARCFFLFPCDNSACYNDNIGFLNSWAKHWKEMTILTTPAHWC